MRFAVSSAIGQSGKLTVRVPTPEDALAWARNLRDQGSAEVIITFAATGARLSEQELKAALTVREVRRGDERPLKGAAPHTIDPKFQAH